MPYQDEETGPASGQPIELYEFTGTYEDYYLTSYAEPVTSGGRVFQPETISRNKLKVATQDEGENALEIVLPFDHPMVATYAYQNAPPTLQCTIYRAHRTDPNDRVTLWSGRVTGFAVEGRTARLRVPSLFSYKLQGNTPTPRFQAPCNHVLYDQRCGVNPALHQHVTTITSVVGTDIAVATLPFATNDAAAGIIFNSAGEARMIVSNLGTALVVSYSFASLQPGDTVTIRKGCDHSFDTCKTKFANGARFGGFPLVPARNPFTSTLE